MSSSNISKTVVLGEASEESDCEEISLTETTVVNCSKEDKIIDDNTLLDDKRRFIVNEQPISIEQNSENIKKSNSFSSSLFSTIGSAASLAKLVNYSAYNLLLTSTPYTASHPKSFDQATISNRPNSPNDMKNDQQQLPLLHKTLFTKNQQFYACMVHLNRHPYEKATKNFNSISQRLVHLQKNIQDIDAAVIRIKREKKNLDTNINLIA